MKYILIPNENARFTLMKSLSLFLWQLTRMIHSCSILIYLFYKSRILKYNGCTIIILLSFIANTAYAKSIIKIHYWQTNNKVPVYFVHTTRSPMLDVKILFNAGSAKDNNLFGIANLAGNMLNEGTNQLNNNQIAEKFDELGTQFYSDVSHDVSTLNLRCLTKSNLLTPSIDLLHNIIINPSFPAKELKRLKQQTLTKIAANQQLPSIVATQNFFKELYGTRLMRIRS